MTDPADSHSTSGTYWVCSACGARVHHDLGVCPECGAYPEEEVAPDQDRLPDILLALVLAGILGMALFLLSRDAEAAREAEQARMTALAPGAGPVGVVPATPTPTPRPRPTATPTPLPRPTPTPPPFDPAAMGIPPTPTPVPTATPAPPTPTPTPSMLDLRDQIRATLRQDLDSRLPLAGPGDFVRLTLWNNRVISGTLRQVDARQFQLQSGGSTQWIPFRQLSQDSRLRVDPSERETWLEEKALEEVLNRL